MSNRPFGLWTLALVATLAGPGIGFAQEPGDEAEAPASAARPKGPVDLNSATAAELEALPGVGKVTARKIIDGRPYFAVEGLRNAGIPARTVQNLRGLVVVRPYTRPKPGKAPGARSAPATTAGPIDVNNADAKAIESLPGIGPSLARAIVAGRPYRTLEDLDAVKGIGPAKLAALRGRVRFGAPGAARVDAPEPETAPAAPASLAAAEPAPGPTSRPAAEPKAAPASVGKININNATIEQLDTLPGIGPAKARAIIDARPYAAIEEITRARGIGDATLAKLRDRITVD